MVVATKVLQENIVEQRINTTRVATISILKPRAYSRAKSFRDGNDYQRKTLVWPKPSPSVNSLAIKVQ